MSVSFLVNASLVDVFMFVFVVVFVSSACSRARRVPGIICACIGHLNWVDWFAHDELRRCGGGL